MRNIIKRVFALVLAALMFTFSFTAYAEDENYVVGEDETVIHAVGEHEREINSEYEYTVYAFAPSEIGKYTLSVDDGVIGLASNNGMWVTVDLTVETVKDTAITWDCSSVGQSILVAVKNDKASVVITVEWEELIVETITITEYKNKVKPETFSYEGNADALQYVETFDDIENSAVLGDDGFYHLDSDEGPILYARLNDSMLSLEDAYSYGQLTAVIYNDEGKAVEKIDYNNAFSEYLLCYDDGLYPLTEDIIAFYQEMGKNNNWYGADGWIGGEKADAWMFACYYSHDTDGLGDVNNDGEINQYDYILVKRHYFETRYLTDDEMVRADVNFDGEVNQFDYILIARHYFGTYVIG